MSTPTIYFAYGSNMWLDQMKRRCKDSEFIGIGVLANWRWIINQRYNYEGYATIISAEEPDDVVYGSMYYLSKEDEDKLDGFEGVPNNYRKESLSITYLGKEEVGEVVDGKRTVQALVYVDVKHTTPGKPKREYIGRMNSAIADGVGCGIPEEYIERYLRPFIPKDATIPN